VENVPNFKASGAGAMMGTTLRRMGYFLTEMVLNGLDFGAYQGPRFRTTEQKVWMMLITLKHGKCKATR
ncbi:hypothetical protein ACFMJ7_19505, partial [Acinetobacter baumannii]